MIEITTRTVGLSGQTIAVKAEIQPAFYWEAMKANPLHEAMSRRGHKVDGDVLGLLCDIVVESTKMLEELSNQAANKQP